MVWPLLAVPRPSQAPHHERCRGLGRPRIGRSIWLSLRPARLAGNIAHFGQWLGDQACQATSGSPAAGFSLSADPAALKQVGCTIVCWRTSNGLLEFGVQRPDLPLFQQYLEVIRRRAL